MAEEKPRSNVRRRVAIQTAIGVAVIALFVSAGWYLSSPTFRDWVRGRLVAQLEDATGGKVEIRSFEWNLSRLEFDVHDLTIRGTEAPDEIPYVHADRLVVRAKILSIMRRDIRLQSVQLYRPVIHIIVYPDGRTNQPVPRAVSRGDRSPMQELFDLAINTIEVSNGELILNEKRTPLDFSARNLKARMDYFATENKYDGKISLKSLSVKYAGLLPAHGDANIDFSLFPDHVDVSGLHLVSGKSKIDASGRLANFRKPIFDVTYRASLDAQELARTTNSPGVGGGIVDVNGAAHYEKASLQSNGSLVVHNLDYRARGIPLSNVDAAAQFALDREQIVLSNLVARVFGGIFKGDAKVANWTVASSPSTKPTQQTGTANLRVESLPIGEVAQAFSTKRLDLGRLNLVGKGTGTVQVQWKGTAQRAIADIALAVTPPEQFSPEQLPVSANLQVRVDAASDVVQVKQLDASLPDLKLNAAGVVGRGKEKLRLSLDVADLTRLKPMLTALKTAENTAGDLTGQLSFEGELTGKLAEPSVRGKVKVKDLTFPLEALLATQPQSGPHSQPRPQRMHVDSGSAELAYSPQGIIIRKGEVQRAGAQASFDVSATLSNGNIVDTSSIAVHLVIRDASLADLQQIAGYNYPVTGTVAASLNIGGTRGSPEGGGRIQITNAVAYGEPIKSASADMQLAQQEARIQNFRLIHNGAKINGSGSYNLKSHAVQFQLTGDNFQMAKIRRFNSGRGTIAGLLRFNANGSGTTHAPIINATARLHNVVVNGERAGDATLMAVTQGDTLRLTGRSNFRNAELTADGSIKIRDKLFPANITARFSDFDFMPFLQPLLQGRLSGKSYVGGSVTVQGPLAQPRSLTVVAEIPAFRAELQGIEVRNPEPIRASMMNQVVQIESFRLIGQDTEINARGRIDLNGNTRLRLRANGRANLKLAQAFNPDLTSSGQVDFNMNIGGPVKKPTVQGEVRVTNGAFNLIDFSNGLSNVNGVLLFTEDRVQVQSLSAHTGGGDIQIGGYATYSPQLGFSLTATGQDIRLRYPQGVSSTANIDLTLTGTLNNSLLSGDVTITRFGFNNQFDLGLYLAKSKGPADTQRASPLNNLRLNVHVVSTPELQVQSSVAKLAGNVDLNIRGVASNPVVLGRVSATEGQISFNGQTYRLERGDVTFSNPAKTEPTLDVEATTKVRNYDLTIRLVGPPSRGLKPAFRSDPPLPDADIVNLLAFGRTREETQLVTSQSSTSFTNSVSEAVLGQAINSAVSNRVQRLFGVSRVKISPELAGTTQTTNPSAQVTIEQSVSEKVTITYITNLAQSSQQSIFVEYNVNRNVSLIAGRDQYGVVSFDIRVRQRKR